MNLEPHFDLEHKREADMVYNDPIRWQVNPRLGRLTRRDALQYRSDGEINRPYYQQRTDLKNIDFSFFQNVNVPQKQFVKPMNEGKRETPPMANRGRFGIAPKPLRQVLEPSQTKAYGDSTNIPNFQQKLIPKRPAMEDLARNFLSGNINQMSRNQETHDRQDVVNMLQGIGQFGREDESKSLFQLVEKYNSVNPEEKQIPNSSINQIMARQQQRNQRPVNQDSKDLRNIQAMDQHNKTQEIKTPVRTPPTSLKRAKNIFSDEGFITARQSPRQVRFNEPGSTNQNLGRVFEGIGGQASKQIVPETQQQQSSETLFAEITPEQSLESLSNLTVNEMENQNEETLKSALIALNGNPFKQDGNLRAKKVLAREISKLRGQSQQASKK